MDSMEWIALISIIIIVMIIAYIDSQRKMKLKILNMLKNGWGKAALKEMSYEDFENISHYFRNSEDKRNTIDDITWDDLDMDGVFELINNTHSSVGQEYLYKVLRTLETSVEELKERDRLAGFFAENEEKRIKIQRSFVRLGYAKHISVTDNIELIVSLTPGGNIIHLLGNLLFFASILFCIFVNASMGVLTVIAATGFCVVNYYKAKAKVEKYFICVKHIVKMITCAGDIVNLKIPELNTYNSELKRLEKEFFAVVKNSYLLSSTNANGSLADIILDYIRMVTHFDLIKFNSMVKQLRTHEKDIYSLIEQLGKLESSIAIASFREFLPYWCVPELSNSRKLKINVQNVYHPLIEEPVANSIREERSVLLTGSNASGKSTFLKTIAINAILSQTIYTSLSEEYQANYYRIFSSMALRDDLRNHESYYIVEIKALKRILDQLDTSSVPILCFVDEVLRGTNTVERISASSQILYSLTGKNVLCFAATHDIELTRILENHYANYHFQEDVSENDILFNYNLFKGRATSRNAIKLLGIIGYDKDIIRTSEETAQRFVKEGNWQKI